jgi:ribokinase
MAGSKKKITVIGSSNVDFIMTMDHLPAVGESVSADSYMQTFGGKGANQAVGAARAGGDVSFVNCVGDDLLSQRMLENFKEAGIDTRYVWQEKGSSSGVALIMIGQAGSNYLSVIPGANGRITPERVESVADLIRESGILLLQYEIPGESNARVLKLAQEAEVPVMWNFAPAKEIDRKLFELTTILVVNETEAAFLLGTEEEQFTPEQMVMRLRALGPETVVITLGAEGVTAGDGEGLYQLPAFAVEAVDTTAAGDVYCGALAVALSEGKSLEEALRFASAAGALSVTKIGAQPSAPSRREIEEFLKEK